MSSNTHSQDKSNDSGQHAEEAQPTENAAETNGPDEVNEPQSGETANVTPISEIEPGESEEFTLIDSSTIQLMGTHTKHEISTNTQDLVAVIGRQSPVAPSLVLGDLEYSQFPTCEELNTLKEETKLLETFFGTQVVLIIDQYALRHKAGYIKVDNGKVAYLYPIRSSNVYIRLGRGEEDQLVQWKEGFRYCMTGGVLFKPVDDPIEYVMFTFRKKE
ncbi:hypothetical protein BFJ66_g13047 [Fusarium oxysporum f. sp. cepae]|uniref:Uncharacterized protein n=1 Tax=Fusarium oxysporum f. sp. cepae TaxID=396571 RepID=A0A3L6NLM4_FUSOX|nr:hypothetical protein BFJ65_g6172 [Fusarium oxysporum f. sp. cepae]RKK37278.1 hypothetical protein BFJ66_g13047 [Fusarium oxysporum f. sp. cepae]